MPELLKLSKLKDNWDSYGAPAPNSTSIENLAEFAETLYRVSSLKPGVVVPSVEGGTAMVFQENNMYFDIEFLNDGSCLVGKYIGTDPVEAYEFDLIPDDIEKVINELQVWF